MELEFLAQLGFELVAAEPINQPVEPFSHGILDVRKETSKHFDRGGRGGGAEDRRVDRSTAQTVVFAFSATPRRPPRSECFVLISVIRPRSARSHHASDRR